MKRARLVRRNSLSAIAIARDEQKSACTKLQELSDLVGIFAINPEPPGPPAPVPPQLLLVTISKRDPWQIPAETVLALKDRKWAQKMMALQVV